MRLKKRETLVTKASYVTWGSPSGATVYLEKRNDMVRSGCQVENRLREEMMKEKTAVELLHYS